MNLTVVDYSDFYFGSVLEIPLPARRGGKLVVVTNGSQRYAVFSPRGLSAYHASIVERFLRQQGVEGRYDPRGEVFRFDSRDWAVEGGAHWTLDDATGVLNLFGHSQAYGSLDLSKLAQELAGTGAFSVVVSSGTPHAGTKA